MIKKLHALVCTISLLTALPAFGMENDTYPCDSCQQEKLILDQLHIRRATIKCTHILCKDCKHYPFKWEEMLKPENDKIWWDCTYCSYFYNGKNKQCWEVIPQNNFFSRGTTDSFCHFATQGITAHGIKKMYPDRVLLDVTEATSFGSNPNDTTCTIS